ncbi:YdcF family protein [Mesobacillus harenae]|uniref:YdcF family protein n=1 Tax=Mesobacillus harenae TaxID=2213203 RepID=UPI001580BFD0|nr:YdcF family protein [Mesobacillus harenae]
MNKKKRIWLLCSLAVLGFLYVAALQYKISQHWESEAPQNADYVIILGARVKGTVPSLALNSRIQAAVEYLEENEEAIIIASGGRGPGEDISEAEAIKRELIKQGINESQIFLEEKSTDTYENIRMSKALISDHSQTGIVVTNTFHVYRSVQIAKDEGLTIAGLSAETPSQAVPKSYIREYMAITKYYLIKYLNRKE